MPETCIFYRIIFSVVSTTESASTTDIVTTPAVCGDLSTKCEFFKKYCGINVYVTKRCQETCGECSMSIC